MLVIAPLVATIRDYLQLGRAQTATAEGAVFPLIAYLGGAPLWSLILFALIGFLVHVGGFAENGMSDLKYDRTDPNKTHHPVVAGRISIRSGWIFAEGFFAAGAVLFFALALYRGAYLAILPFIAFLVLARAYNFLGKRWKPGAVLSISGCFSLSPLACGMAWTDHLTLIVLAVAIYAVALEAFQIAISGEMKDLAQTGEPNLLRDLGARLEWSPFNDVAYLSREAQTSNSGSVEMNDRARAFADKWFSPGPTVIVFGGFLTLAKILALEWVVLVVAGGWAGPPFALFMAVVAGSAITALFLGYLVPLLRPGPFDRARRVRTMGLGEVASYFLLILAVGPLLLPWLWVPFVVAPVLWYAVLNKALWSTGSAWAPGV